MEFFRIQHLLSNIKRKDMKAKVLIAILISSMTGLFAQVTTGTISGKVVSEMDGEIIPGCKIWIETESGKRFVASSLDGKYSMDAIKPGVYTVYALCATFDSCIVKNVTINPDAITFLDLKMPIKSSGTVTVIYTAPVIDPELPRLRIPTAYIAQSPDIRNPLALLSSYSSEIKYVEGSGQVIIRGSRPGDAVYYIDGVKMTDMSSVPGVSIGSLEAYTGGIPAKYGDTTGGVVSLETKSYFDLYNAWLATQ